MSGSLDELVRDLRRFVARREVTQALRRRIREPVPAIRRAVRARALATLPARGGLAGWVAASSITVRASFAGRGAGVRLRAGRNSRGGRSDIRAIDQGRVRAPSWGRRGRSDWHVQTVPAGFFAVPAGDLARWRAVCDAAIEDALQTVRLGGGR